MSRFEQAREWWQARAARERRMLLAMAAAVAAFAWWYGLLVPLERVRGHAEAGHRRAAVALATVQAGLATLQAQGGVAPPSGTAALAEAVANDARDSGIAIAREREGDAGEWVVEVDAADHAALVAWLARMRERHRLAPDALHVTTDGGRLRVQARFASALR
jgi:general secretion pathway protein M